MFIWMISVFSFGGDNGSDGAENPFTFEASSTENAPEKSSRESINSKSKTFIPVQKRGAPKRK